MRRSSCLTWCLALSVTLLSGSALCSNETAVVEVEAFGGDDPPVREAVLRIQAELRAVGFGVRLMQGTRPADSAPQEPVAPPVGRLLLVRSGTTVQILAHGAFLEAPLTQQVDLTRSSTTAEVLAIRAVEALRAALVQSLRDKTLQRESVPGAVLTFTQWSESAREPPLPAPSVEPAPVPAAPPPAPDSTPSEGDDYDGDGDGDYDGESTSKAWLLAAGPLLHQPSREATPSAGAEAQIGRSIGRAFVGVLVDASLSPSRWSSDRGTVEAREMSLLARAGVNLSCPVNVTCQLGAGLGARRSSFVATPSDGSRSVEKEQHVTALVEVDALFGYFFVGRAGALVHGRIGGLLDKPTLDAGDEEASTWGRPSFSLALSAALRF